MIRFENVSYAYPFRGELAARELSFSVAPGELVLCTGGSGSGKSTLVRLANGICPRFFKGGMEGRVLIGGEDAAAFPLHLLADRVGSLFQNPEEQFLALSVEDELRFAHEWRGRSAEETDRLVSGPAEELGLVPLMRSSVYGLSEGQKQRLGLASILSQGPAALVLDEPTANLDPETTLDLARMLVDLKRRGLAVLVADHRLYWLKDAADRVLIMRDGRIEREGPFAVLRDDALRAEYGLRRAEVEDGRALLPPSPERGSLSVEALSFAYRGKAPLFEKARFALSPGVTALIGDNGTGKTTLARLLTGLLKARGGTFRLEGKSLAPKALLRRAGLVLQNADHQLAMRTALEEVVTSLRLAGKPEREWASRARELLADFGLLRHEGRHPQSLSGGEKQRLTVACALAKEPDILILDEPTSGLDGENMRRIAAALEARARGGAHMLLITHDLELMDAACTRALRLPLPAAKQGESHVENTADS
jgi:energy-coupling factor transport system ATP-binding protein